MNWHFIFFYFYMKKILKSGKKIWLSVSIDLYVLKDLEHNLIVFRKFLFLSHSVNQFVYMGQKILGTLSQALMHGLSQNFRTSVRLWFKLMLINFLCISPNRYALLWQIFPDFRNSSTSKAKQKFLSNLRFSYS